MTASSTISFEREAEEMASFPTLKIHKKMPTFLRHLTQSNTNIFLRPKKDFGVIGSLTTSALQVLYLGPGLVFLREPFYVYFPHPIVFFFVVVVVAFSK